MNVWLNFRFPVSRVFDKLKNIFHIIKEKQWWVGANSSLQQIEWPENKFLSTGNQTFGHIQCVPIRWLCGKVVQGMCFVYCITYLNKFLLNYNGRECDNLCFECPLYNNKFNWLFTEIICAKFIISKYLSE